MGSLLTLNFPTGNIGFASSVRGWDEEPRDAFRIELPNRPIMYGEWRTKFADVDRDDFNIEIVSVGYVKKGHLGSSIPIHRKKFSASEQLAVEELIRALFADPNAKAGVAPFSTKKARFLGGVNFAPGWILQSDELEGRVEP